MRLQYYKQILLFIISSLLLGLLRVRLKIIRNVRIKTVCTRIRSRCSISAAQQTLHANRGLPHS